MGTGMGDKVGWIRAGLSSMLAFACVVACGQDRELRAAESFAASLGLKERLQLDPSSRNKPVQTYKGATYNIWVREGRATGYESSVPADDPSTAPSKGSAVKSMDQAWGIAERWLDAHHIPYGQRGDGNATGVNVAGAAADYMLAWKEEAFGFPVFQGNGMSVVVNAYSGKVVQMSRRTEYVYDPPVQRVALPKAADLFRAKVRAVLAKDIERVKLEKLGYFGPYPQRTSLRPKPPHSRLRYLLSGNLVQGSSSVMGMVDAETGDVYVNRHLQHPTAPAMGRDQSDVAKFAKQFKLPVPTAEVTASEDTTYSNDNVYLYLNKSGYANWVFRKEELPGMITDDESLWRAAEAWLAKHQLAFEMRGTKKIEPNGINLTWMISHNGIPVSSKAPITMMVGSDRTHVLGLGMATFFLDERPKMTEAEALLTFLKLTKGKVDEVKAVGLYYGSYMSAGLTGQQYMSAPESTTPRLYYGFDATVDGGHHLYAAIGAAGAQHPILGDRKGDLPDPRIAKYRVVVATPPNLVVPIGMGCLIGAGAVWLLRRKRLW